MISYCSQKCFPVRVSRDFHLYSRSTINVIFGIWPDIREQYLAMYRILKKSDYPVTCKFCEYLHEIEM